jgi:predicted anti-sigma-YlaC factor YlaD
MGRTVRFDMRLRHESVTPCDQAREYVSLAVDGELVEVERVRLDAHLGTCAECRAFQADVETVARELRAAELEKPAYPVVLPRLRRLSVRSIQMGAAAAAVIAVVVAGSTLQNLGRQSTNQSLGLPANALFQAGDDVAPNLHPSKQNPPKHRVAV